MAETLRLTKNECRTLSGELRISIAATEKRIVEATEIMVSGTTEEINNVLLPLVGLEIKKITLEQINERLKKLID